MKIPVVLTWIERQLHYPEKENVCLVVEVCIRVPQPFLLKTVMHLMGGPFHEILLDASGHARITREAADVENMIVEKDQHSEVVDVHCVVAQRYPVSQPHS